MNVNKQIEKYVGIVVLIALVVAFIPTLLASFANLSALNIPLAGLFDPDTGIVMLVLIVGVFYAIIKAVSNKK